MEKPSTSHADVPVKWPRFATRLDNAVEMRAVVQAARQLSHNPMVALARRRKLERMVAAPAHFSAGAGLNALPSTIIF